jgi:hypothetical protein
MTDVEAELRRQFTDAFTDAEFPITQRSRTAHARRSPPATGR